MRRFAGIASTLFTCAVGCGSDEVFTDAGQGIDARSADADTTAPDASLDAAPVTTMVTTYARCAPDGTCTDAPDARAAGVDVIVLGPDGSAGQIGVTDSSGELVLTDLEAGSSVTVVYTFAGGEHGLTTTTGVEPGDHLVYGEHYYEVPPSAGVAGTMTVTFPAVANAASYVAVHRCQNDSITDPAPASLTLTQSAFCQGPTSDILLEAHDGGGALLAAGFIDDAPYTNGATASLATWTAATDSNYTVSVTGLPADVPGVWIWGNASFPALGDFGSSDLFSLTAGAAQLVATVPPVGERTWSAAELLHQGDLGDQVTLRGGAAAATTATLTTPTVPRLGQLTVNAPLGALSWIQGAGAYDAGYATVRWNQSEGFYGDNWDIVFPPGVTAFQWSAVPAALATYLPQTDDAIDGRVTVLDLGSAADYDAARALPSWELACPDCAIKEGDQTAIDLAYDWGGGEGPVVFFRPTAPPARGHVATTTARR